MTRIWQPSFREVPEKPRHDALDAETDTGQAHVLLKCKAHC